MDPTAVDPAGISVPGYDEDLEESFSGPIGIAEFYDEDEQAYYEGEGYDQSEPLEQSAAHSANPDEVAQADILRDHTHLWLYPLPTCGKFPAAPPQQETLSTAHERGL